MNVLADALTATRCVLALIILCIGVLQGVEEGLSTIVALTVLSWTTDVLDGPLARRASRPTRLGHCDLVADLGLTLALALCLVTWGALPLLPVAGGLAIAGLGAHVFHSLAPLRFAMGLVYGAFILTAWLVAPRWGRTLAGGVGLVVLLNPRRAWQQVTGFLGEVAAILGRGQPGTARTDHRATG